MSSNWTLRNKPIVAVGLLTQDDLTALGPAFDRAWPIDQTPCFEELLQAIDESDLRGRYGRDHQLTEEPK
jgi:hypothetical protein